MTDLDRLLFERSLRKARAEVAALKAAAEQESKIRAAYDDAMSVFLAQAKVHLDALAPFLSDRDQPRESI